MDLKKTHSDQEKAEQDLPKNAKSNGDKPMRNNEVDLYEEVGDLAKYISAMSQKISSAETLIEDVYVELPRGSDQLLEVTRKTEEATQHILDDTEKMIGNHELMSTKLESLKATLFGETLQNTMAVKEDVAALSALFKNNKEVMFNLVGTLSFQDPAGQEIKKVDAMLQNLQSRLLKMVITFGKEKKKDGISDDRERELLSELGDTSKKEKRLSQELVDSVLRSYGF